MESELKESIEQLTDQGMIVSFCTIDSFVGSELTESDKKVIKETGHVNCCLLIQPLVSGQPLQHLGVGKTMDDALEDAVQKFID